MRENEEIQLLKDIMEIPSVNGRDDEGKVAEYLCDYLNAAGIPARVDRIDETHANVVAMLEGTSDAGPVIWNGHLDTVPYGSGEDWHTDPAKPVEKGTRLYGRGASDMKSGLCAMVSALCRFKRSGKKAVRSICFAGTCDEEKYGRGAEYFLQNSQFSKCGQILIGEPTGLKLGVAQKGCIWLELLLHGKTSHGAYPDKGCSAVEAALNISYKIKAYVEKNSHNLLGTATANITQISGGTAPNMIPETCRLLMDIRVVPGLTDEMVLTQALQYFEEEQKRTGEMLQGNVQIINNRRAIETGETSPLVCSMKQSIQAEGLKTECIGINFFTDASILARNLPDAQVLLFGPGEPSMAHQPDEFVDLENYMKAVRIFTSMIEYQT